MRPSDWYEFAIGFVASVLWFLSSAARREHQEPRPPAPLPKARVVR